MTPEEKKKCESCEEPFKWDDNVVLVGEDLYHEDCVTLYPTGYVAFIGDDFIGETTNEDGQLAYELINGLLVEDEEAEE